MASTIGGCWKKDVLNKELMRKRLSNCDRLNRCWFKWIVEFQTSENNITLVKWMYFMNDTVNAKVLVIINFILKMETSVSQWLFLRISSFVMDSIPTRHTKRSRDLCCFEANGKTSLNLWKVQYPFYLVSDIFLYAQ